MASVLIISNRFFGDRNFAINLNSAETLNNTKRVSLNKLRFLISIAVNYTPLLG